MLHHVLQCDAFFFSYSTDLTHTAQRIVSKVDASIPLWQRVSVFVATVIPTSLCTRPTPDSIGIIWCSGRCESRDCIIGYCQLCKVQCHTIFAASTSTTSSWCSFRGEVFDSKAHDSLGEEQITMYIAFNEPRIVNDACVVCRATALILWRLNN